MAQMFGAYRGTVIGTADPTGNGRIQVRIPSVLSASAQWAEVCRPFGAPTGAARIGGDVVVIFEGGDPDQPIVVGSLP